MQCTNYRCQKSPCKIFWPYHNKKTEKILLLRPSNYIPQNPQNTISQTVLKHCNESRSVRTEDLRWVKITTDTGTKIKV